MGDLDQTCAIWPSLRKERWLMGLDVYLSWDGGSYKDQAVQDGDGPNWYDEPFEHGRQGQLRGWRWWELLFKEARYTETVLPDSAMSSSELFKRFPRFVFHLTEEVGPGWFDDPYWQRYMLQAMGFLQVLEAISRESRLTK